MFTYFLAYCFQLNDVTKARSTTDGDGSANQSSRLERSQALLDKFSEHEVGFIFCEENGITSV